MASFVGDLWKRVSSNLSISNSSPSNGPSSASLSWLSSVPSAFPYSFNLNEGALYQCGPFQVYQGYDHSEQKMLKKNPGSGGSGSSAGSGGSSVPSIKQLARLTIDKSNFTRVSVLVCRERHLLSQAQLALKTLRSLKHPRILKFVAAQESADEIVLITEWAEPLSRFSETQQQQQQYWKEWAAWCARDALVFLHEKSGRAHGAIDDCEGSLWVAASGALKITFFSYGDSSSDLQQELSQIQRLFGISDSPENPLISLNKTFDSILTISSGERQLLIKKISQPDLWRNTAVLSSSFKKYFLLLELVQARRLMTPFGSGGTLLPMEELVLMFDGARELIDPKEEGADFIYLLGDLYSEQLEIALRNAAGSSPPGPLLYLLDLVAGKSSIARYFPSNYAYEMIFTPLVIPMLQHPLPQVREAALRTLLPLSERLSPNHVSNDLLRQLARMQNDPEGPLRLQSLMVLSKLMPGLADSLKSKIFGPAITRSLADPFVPCKRAAMNLLQGNRSLLQSDIDKTEIAGKMIPALGSLMVSKDGAVREEALQCMEHCVMPVMKAWHEEQLKNAKGEKSETEEMAEGSEVKFDSRAIGNSPKPKAISGMDAAKVSSPTTASSTNVSNINSEPHSNPSTMSMPATSTKLKLGSIKKIA